MNSTVKKYTFKKKERLTKKEEINNLFNEGSSFMIYPFRFIYIVHIENINTSSPIKALITVPKKNHKKAVHRNLIKRRVKEAFRKIKPGIYEEDIFQKIKINLGILYISKEILTYYEMDKKLLLGLKKLVVELSKRHSF